MNHDENLTYEWLRNLRSKLLKEDEKPTSNPTATTVQNQCPPDFPYAASKNSRYASLYGDFCYQEKGGGNIDIQPPWEQNNLTTISVNNRSYTINKFIADHFIKTYDEAVRVSGYKPYINGIYNSRHVEGGGISAHSWGMAIDFDSTKNPWIKDATKNNSMPSSMDNNPNFIRVFETNGFAWLGTNATHPRGVGDDMHFYYNKKIDNVGPMFTGLVGSAGGGVSDGGFSSVDSAFAGSSYNNIDSRSYRLPFISSLIGGNDNPLADLPVPEMPSMIKENTTGVLSDDQIAKLCYDVGFRGEDLVTAVRIVMGESGGNPKSRNVNSGGSYPGSIDRGLFQLNSVAFSKVPDNEAYDPIKNAQHAYAAYSKYGFRPWKGRTRFHTLKWEDLTPDTDKIERAKNAVAKLTGYTSTGKFDYIPADGATSTNSFAEKQYSNWSDYTKSTISNLVQDNPLANLNVPEAPSLVKNNPLGESKFLREDDKLINPKDKFKVRDKTKDHRLEKNKKVLLDMLSFYDKKLKFEKPVLIKFVDDEQNAGKLLGKTAFYDPDKTSITIFTTNRLLKDILRSLGHELIHHKQHCKDEFHDVQTFEGYAQKDKKLRRKEKEAYLFGNMLFRDWEDNYKSNHKETR